MTALLVGIIPNAPGFLSTVGLISKDLFPHWIDNLYHYAWFVGFGVSGIIYYVLMRHNSEKSLSKEIVS